MVRFLAVARLGGVLLLDIITRNHPIQSSWWLRLTWPPDDIRHIRGIWTDFNLLVVRLSALFKPTWQGAQFVARYGTDRKSKTCDPETRAVLNFITNYLSREDAYFLEVENYAIEYMNFDWRLNDTSRGYRPLSTQASGPAAILACRFGGVRKNLIGGQSGNCLLF